MKKALFLLLAVLLTACSQQGQWQRNDGLVFGTVYSISYQYGEDLRADIETALAQVDQEFSMFNEESTVARINRGDTTVARSAMFQEVYELAQQVNKDTHGAFDVTVAPLVNAWGFGFKHEQMPTAAQVDSLLKIRSQMDFSAIAKGYGCDAVARLLEQHGIANYMVDIGGEVVVHGQSSRGQDWRVGVTKPTDDDNGRESNSSNSVCRESSSSNSVFSSELQAILSLTDIAMATSGNYRNFYYKDGRRYAHTIDPRTGYPVQHELLSATVLADRCAKADAYATSFMVLGLDSARLLLDRHPDLKAYLIYTAPDGNLAVWHSPELNIEN